MAAQSLADNSRWPAAPVIYQVYPRSFFDSDGDGIGDLPGITQKLDHIAQLGVDAVWLSPFYVSGWQDGGYDVIDHTAVDPMLGTMDDFDALVARAHALGLKVMIDQVLNHTSDKHPWFLAALDGDDDCAARYLFEDAKPDGTPPNNWLSQFGLPGWEWSHLREQYYFHQFLPCQPSVNLRDPAVQESHAAQIARWRARGVDGFRFDAVTSYFWDESLADNPPASDEVRAKVSGNAASPYTYQDHVYDMLPGDGADYMEKLRAWAGDDAYLIGENTSGNKSVELAMSFTGPGRLDACYTTDLPEEGGSPQVIQEMIARADLQRLVGWLSSHDQPRHLDAGEHAHAQAKIFAAMMAFLPGPWLIYQGEEFGLAQPELQQDEITDPLDLNFWPNGPGREGSRVPIPWNDDAQFRLFRRIALAADEVGESRRKAGGTARQYRDLIELRRKYQWSLGDVEDCRS